MAQPFTGVWPALLTPATAKGDVNYPVLRELVEHLLNKQVDGLYVCGGTGEGIYLSVPERKQVLETVLDQVRGRVPVIVHVGSVATRDAVCLAQHAQQVGASGVSAILPLVNAGLENIYLHYTTIAAAAPALPFFPYLFGGQTNAVSLMEGLLERIPNVSGAKYTGPNMFELKQLAALGTKPAWTIFAGMDEQSLFALMAGAPGHIGSTLNLMPGVYREIRRLYHCGQVAQALDLQQRANRVTATLISFGFAGALRAAMRLIGFDLGQPRLPALPLLAEKQASLRSALEEAGWAELVAL
ncbi:MAG TPA: dihydrodipicolinate synthase family protein [Caldilineaceae bacterium]|nr:dihydrodipicolinate synthase family protein [Caldilineaceae bacterium]